MSNDNTLVVYYDGNEIEVKDPSSQESFLEAFKNTIDKFASENYAMAYESDNAHYEISQEDQRSFANAFDTAIREYRANSLLPADSEDRHDIPWNSWLDNAIYQVLGLDYSPQEEAQDNCGFHAIYEAIEEAMSEHDGPVCDLDELWSEISSRTTWAMEELDTSTLFDTYGKVAMKFVYIPNFNGKDGHIDDYTFYMNNLQHIDPDSNGFDSFINLLRIDPIDLMEELSIDHEDTALVNKWIASSALANHTMDSVLPMDQVIELLENAGARYAHPCWMGDLTLNELAKIDPLKPLELSGGSLGLNDATNGAGYMIDLPSNSKFVLTEKEGLLGEWGYTMECSKGFVKNPAETKKRQGLSFSIEP